jgi:hypothetical protein
LTKENILSVATDMFAKYGYDAVSMNKLASNLDVNKATIYYHFKDKKSLYSECIKLVMIDVIEDLKILSQSSSTPKEQLVSYINIVIKSYKNKPQLIPLALRELANYGVNIDESIVPYFQIEIDILKSIVDKLPLKDKYKEMDIYALFSIIHGSIKSYYPINICDFDLSGRKEYEKCSDDILDYISNLVSNIVVDAICKE